MPVNARDVADLVERLATLEKQASVRRQIARTEVDAVLFPTGRLTLTSGTPVTTTDVNSATSIYYTPYLGNTLPIHDGSDFILTTFEELTLALDSNAGHAGYHQASKNFDLFVVNDAGTARLGTGPAWSSDTTRGTGAGTTELERINGIYTNKYDMTLRFGSASGNTLVIGSNEGTYVGTVHISAITGLTFDAGGGDETAASRFLWNSFNRVPRVCSVFSTINSWTYNSATWRQANNSAAYGIYVVVGLVIDPVECEVYGAAFNSTATARPAFVGIGVDRTNGNDAQITSPGYAGEIVTSLHARYQGYPGIGYHFLAWVESSGATDTMTFLGDNGLTRLQNGMVATVWA